MAKMMITVVAISRQVWPCWRRCATGVGFGLSKTHGRPGPPTSCSPRTKS